MKQRIPALLLVLALMLSASACASVYEAEYSYAAPYSENVATTESGGGTEIRSYSQLKSVLNMMVNSLSPGGELRFSSYEGSVGDDMAAACYEIKTQTPVGAYAVEELDYELSRIVSYYTAQVNISYRYTPEEMTRVTTINGVSALQSHLEQTVASYTEELLLRIYSSTVNEAYLTAIIEGVALTEPFLVTGQPEIRVKGYPNEGLNRIYEIQLDYGLSEANIALRGQQLQQALAEACAQISGEDAPELALQCARYLNEHCLALSVEEAQDHDTAYDALVEQRAGSLGVALAYMAMCREFGIDCRVIRGSYGTMGVEMHHWNIIGIGDDYYHVDVSRFAADGEANVFLLSDEQAWGTYMWAYENYPDCAGPLTYADVIGVTEPEETLANNENDSAETSSEAGENSPVLETDIEGTTPGESSSPTEDGEKT